MHLSNFYFVPGPMVASMGVSLFLRVQAQVGSSDRSSTVTDSLKHLPVRSLTQEPWKVTMRADSDYLFFEITEGKQVVTKREKGAHVRYE